MAWIKVIPPNEAKGQLRLIYDAIIKRSGRVKNVLRILSLRPSTMRATNAWYADIMYSPDSALTRSQREMIATVVSVTNDCEY